MTAIRPLSRETMTGAQKGAVLCMALGPREAARILQHLTADEVEQITREIAALPSVSADLVEWVLSDFQDDTVGVEASARGGVQYAKEVLEQALGPGKSKAVIERIEGQVVDTGLKRLKRAAPEVLSGVLRGEHPQTIALILAHVDSRQAASVVQALEPSLAADVLYRVARMDKISAEMLALVEAGLAGKTDLSLSQDMASSGGPAAVAKLLNLTGGTVEKQLMEGIQQRSGEIASEIKALMFVFEDLLQLDNRSMQRLLRDVESKDLALALKAASDELKRHIKAGMSERAASALDEEIEMLGAVRVRDVEAAHAGIIEKVRVLEEAGEILVRNRGGSDEIIS